MPAMTDASGETVKPVSCFELSLPLCLILPYFSFWYIACAVYMADIERGSQNPFTFWIVYFSHEKKRKIKMKIFIPVIIFFSMPTFAKTKPAKSWPQSCLANWEIKSNNSNPIDTIQNKSPNKWINVVNWGYSSFFLVTGWVLL